MRIKGAGLIVILSLLASRGVARAPQSQNTPPWVAWAAPESGRQMKNPVDVTKAGLAAAATLYHENCQPCHGDTGKGNGPNTAFLETTPANFTDEKMMSEETDGALFWKMSTGQGEMPSWGQLSVTQRWELVNYLRTFATKAAAAKKEGQ